MFPIFVFQFLAQFQKKKVIEMMTLGSDEELLRVLSVRRL